MSMDEPKIMPYLTLIPNRNPRQKQHTDLGQAKKAILYRLDQGATIVDARIYRWSNHGWELLYTIPAGTTRGAMPWL